MADQKVTELVASVIVSTDDVMYVVDAPGTSPVSKKVTFDNLQKSISVVGTTAGVTFLGSVTLPANGVIGIGDQTSDGAWKVCVSSTSLSFQYFVSGTWSEKGAINTL